MILEKVNKLELTLPRVLVDIKLSPRVRHPLPSTSGFALGIVGSAGSGKTSTLISLIKSRDVYRKRFHNIIIEQVEENKEEGEISLLILDDVSAELQDTGILKKMMRLFLNRRHLGLSIIAIAHSLTGKAALPFAIRKNLSHLILFRQASAMEQLNSDTLHMKKDKFSELLHYVFDKPHNHLMIKYSTLELYKNFNTLTLK
jgi:hypothetical protein